MYKDRYGKKPKVNKYRDKWAMQDVIDSVGYDRALELIQYYLKLNRSGHPLNFFYNNFDRMDRVKEETDKDRENRRALREATKRLVEGEE